MFMQQYKVIKANHDNGTQEGLTFDEKFFPIGTIIDLDPSDSKASIFIEEGLIEVYPTDTATEVVEEVVTENKEEVLNTEVETPDENLDSGDGAVSAEEIAPTDTAETTVLSEEVEQ